ncbi:PAS domain-containing protein [Cnuella takakiae]|uniref:PAS domain-containing protein n=1 Tax=Cnuella takakiae TaxID=1302690 RepID=UPI00130151FE|nr:PAS domain-containing protein [Cnuella takakiae]
MELNLKPITSLEHLQSLPGFAAWLRQHHLNSFIEVQLEYSRKLQTPLLKFLERLPVEQFKAIVQEGAEELLDMLAQDDAADFIRISSERWRNNQLPNIDQGNIDSQDITQVGYIRKQAMLHFAPQYCNSMSEALQLAEEIDFFTMQNEGAAFETYTGLLRNKIEEQSYLTSKITNTSPGIIYLFSLRPYSILFANQTAEEFFGIANQDFKKMGTGVFEHIIHPDDLPATFQFLRDISQTRDAEVRTLEFRMKPHNGSYTWMRNYFSVFRRDADGMPTEIIGNILNIQAEKEATERLRESEKRYRQAEALTHIGHYEWDLATDLVLWSEELYRIYELDLALPPLTATEIFGLTHPDDLPKVQQLMQVALENLTPYSFYYRMIMPDGRIKIVQSQGEIISNTDGKPTFVVGTLQDITEKQNLIEQLRYSEEMYKQAEQLAHLGNFNWNMQTNQLSVSEEIYRIYGLDPKKDEFTFERYLSLIHPEDREKALQLMQEVLDQKETRENIHRIIRTDGTVRYVYSVGQVKLDDKGKPLCMIGSAQDITERQVLIEQLQESQKLYQQAQTMAKLGNWTLDLRTDMANWSDEMFHIYELPVTPTPISYQDWQQFIHPDDFDGVMAYFEYCKQNRVPYDKVHRVVLNSGKVKILHRKAEILYNENGDPVKVLGTTQDVTEQLRVQQELRENQMFLRKVTDATPAIIATYQVQTGKYPYVSKGIQNLLGFTPEQAQAEGNDFFRNIMHPDDLEAVIRQKQYIYEQSRPDGEGREAITEFSYRMKDAQGNYRWFHTYATPFDRNEEGRLEHMLNISLDITDQKEATRKIMEQEQFIQNIADASPTILYVYDVTSASFAYVNREIYFMLGYNPEEVLAMGDKVTELLYHPEDLDLVPERKGSNRKIQEKDLMIQYECRLKHSNGNWQWFLVREVVFLTDDADRPKQIVGAALDISKRKDMERTLLQNSFLLKQSNASLEEFAYVASHDLKEPLRKISTFGDRLAATQGDKLGDDGKIYLSKIIDASQRMQTMISDLLSISLITGNKSYESCSLQQVLEETLQTLEFKIEQKNAVIESDGLPVARIVPSQFRQLFQNLIANSLKFVTDGVRPHITITHRYLLPAEIKEYVLQKADRYLEIVLQDNGIGFENEFAGKIFLIFQRLHGRSEYEGSGIGLAICKKIVEHHGGVIFATGSPGEGARFTILLPDPEEN